MFLHSFMYSSLGHKAETCGNAEPQRRMMVDQEQAIISAESSRVLRTPTASDVGWWRLDYENRGFRGSTS